MSTWTPEHKERALAEGWGLFEVIDGTKIYLKAFAAGKGQTHGPALERWLVERARSRSALHIHALQCVMASQIQPKNNTRKRR